MLFRSRTVGGGARCFDGRADHGGPAWRLLPECSPARHAGHGHPDRNEGHYGRERIDFVGDGGDQKSENLIHHGEHGAHGEIKKKQKEQ